MSSYLIVSYDVTDPERYALYNPGSMGVIVKTIAKHGGEVVIAGKPEVLAGDQRHVLVMIKFPNSDAAKAWHEDPEYAPAKEIRLSATGNVHAFIANEFAMPKG